MNSHSLKGKGIGFVDIYILASAYIDSNFLWTLDKKLHAIATKIKGIIIRHLLNYIIDKNHLPGLPLLPSVNIQMRTCGDQIH